jgi:integrase
MSGTHQLMARLLYGSGLRLMECLRLRVKDIDFGHRQIMVRDAKGEKDRVTVLPGTVLPDMQRHLRPASSAATTLMKLPCSEQSERLPERLGSLNRSVLTRFGIPSPRICSKRATTSAPSRNSWAIRT